MFTVRIVRMYRFCLVCLCICLGAKKLIISSLHRIFHSPGGLVSICLLSLFGWLLNRKAARVEVNISLTFLYWVGIALHP